MRDIIGSALAGVAGAVSIGLAGAAHAQTCTSYPNTLTNGTTADATQVMANFNCAALTGAAHFTGNVGIGTSTPYGSLEAIGGELSPSLTYQSGGALVLSDGGNGELAFGWQPSGAYPWWIQARNASSVAQNLVLNPLGGNVGIGTTSPGSPLTVVNTNAAIASVSITVPSGSSAGLNLYPSSGGWLDLLPNTAAGNFNPLVQSGDAAIIFTNGTEGYGSLSIVPWSSAASGVRITPAGYVGIGTASPTYPLYVSGQAGGTTAWSDVSDGRLKKDIVPVTDALALIDRLRPVRFRWRGPSERDIGKQLNLPVSAPQIGFIAQDVAKVLPEAVTVPAKGSADPYGMQETKLIPVLVEAIKEQEAEIKDQRAEIAAQGSTLSAQQAEIAALKAEVEKLKPKT